MTSTLNLGSKIPMSEVDGLTTAMSNKADINFLNVGGGGVNTCFRWLKPDLTRGVTIANNGSMPFDGWAKIIAQTWQSSNTGQTSQINSYINDVVIVNMMQGYAPYGCNNTAAILIPVKAGDVFKYTSSGNGDKYCTCTLYPYEATPEEGE